MVFADLTASVARLRLTKTGLLSVTNTALGLPDGTHVGLSNLLGAGRLYCRVVLLLAEPNLLAALEIA